MESSYNFGGDSTDYWTTLKGGDGGYAGPREVATQAGGWSMNLAGLSGMLSGIGTAIQGGIGIGSALAAPSFADAQAGVYRWAGQQGAADLRRQGDAAVRNIGIVQQQGLDAATLRYNALGAEIAQQRVAAAGSGIDLSSRTVGKAEQTSRKNAVWDVSRISRNTKIAADNYNAQAEAAYRNSAFAQINGEYQAEVAEIQGDLQKKMGLLSGISQMVLGNLQTAISVGSMFAGGAGGGFG